MADYRSYSANDAKDLSDVERIVLRDYTREYSIYDYKDINGYLCSSGYTIKDNRQESVIEERIEILENMIERKELPRQVKLYKGIKNISDLFGKSVEGMTWEEISAKYTNTNHINPAFLSTSGNIKKALEFAVRFFDNKPGLLTIKAPEGTKGMCVGNVSYFGNGEWEVLLQRNSLFHVDSISCTNGLYNVVMTVKGLVK